MTPFLKRNLLIPVAVLLFTGLLYGLNGLIPALAHNIQHLEFIALSFIIMMGLVIMLFWSTSGAFGGLTSFLIALIFLYGPLTDLDPYYYSVLIMAFFLSSFIGYHFYRKISSSNQEYTVRMEKIQEDINLIRNHKKSRVAEVAAMSEKIGGLFRLKNIADKLSVSLLPEEIIKIVVEELGTIKCHILSMML